MPTTVTKTVKSAGGDYTSLSAWEAAQQADLTATDEIRQAEVYDFTDTTAVDINGWTTDATRYIRVYMAAANGHAGTWNTSKYNLTVNTSSVHSLTIQENYVRIEGLQIAGIHADSQHGIDISNTGNAASSDIRLDRIIVSDCGGTSTVLHCIKQNTGLLTVRNSVLYGNHAGDGFSAVGGTSNLDNVTVGLVGRNGFENSFGAGTITLRNCYAHKGSGSCYDGTISRTTCAHSSATVHAGSTASIAYSTANFTNVTAGSENLHLVSGASATLLTGGTDLSGTFTTDIDGETRSDWSIGADEFIAATGNRRRRFFMGAVA